MCPRGFAGQKFLEEAGGSNRTGSAPVGDVFDIGHIRFNQFAVGVGQRKAPQLFARLFAGNGQQFGQDVVVAEQTGHLVAQRYDNRAGQRGEVDDALRLIFLFNISQAVAQDQAPLGVRVEDFYGLAGKRSYDVAGAGGGTGGHIFDQTDDADDIQVQFLLCGGLERGDDDRGTGHILFHIPHAGGRF